MSLAEFNVKPAPVEVQPLARRRTKARAAARFGVVYDQERDVYVVSLGKLAEHVGEHAAHLAYNALYEKPARRLAAGVKRALRKYRRDGEAVIRAVKKEKRVKALREQKIRDTRERIWRALPTFAYFRRRYVLGMGQAH